MQKSGAPGTAFYLLWHNDSFAHPEQTVALYRPIKTAH